MSGLIVLAVLVAYATTGVLAARHRYAEKYREELRDLRRSYPHTAAADPDSQRRDARQDATEAALVMLLGWPFVLAFRGVGAWFHAPVEKTDQRIAQLRADAAMWDGKRRTGTDVEREMAAQLARMCRELADDLERAA